LVERLTDVYVPDDQICSLGFPGVWAEQFSLRQGS
jgi:hypothetical protein